MRKTIEYVVVLVDGIRKRHRHEMERGQIVTFVVQLEMLSGQTWLPVVRYDCAHGFCHRDAYHRNGKQTKTELALSFDHALTFADWDISENWENYCGRFSKGQTP